MTTIQTKALAELSRRHDYNVRVLARTYSWSRLILDAIALAVSQRRLSPNTTFDAALMELDLAEAVATALKSKTAEQVERSPEWCPAFDAAKSSYDAAWVTAHAERRSVETVPHPSIGAYPPDDIDPIEETAYALWVNACTDTSPEADAGRWERWMAVPDADKAVWRNEARRIAARVSSNGTDIGSIPEHERAGFERWTRKGVPGWEPHVWLALPEGTRKSWCDAAARARSRK